MSSEYSTNSSQQNHNDCSSDELDENFDKGLDHEMNDNVKQLEETLKSFENPQGVENDESQRQVASELNKNIELMTGPGSSGKSNIKELYEKFNTNPHSKSSVTVEEVDDDDDDNDDTIDVKDLPAGAEPQFNPDALKSLLDQLEGLPDEQRKMLLANMLQQANLNRNGNDFSTMSQNRAMSTRDRLKQKLYQHQMRRTGKAVRERKLEEMQRKSGFLPADDAKMNAEEKGENEENIENTEPVEGGETKDVVEQDVLTTASGKKLLKTQKRGGRRR